MTTDRDAKPWDCADVRDLFPLSGLGVEGAGKVAAHLASCAECRDAAEFVEHLQGFRPEPPASILRGVLERHQSLGHTAGRTRNPVVWWLSAAAVAALALGIGMLADSTPTAESLWTLALDPEPATWYGDDWMVAGEPVPGGLSDDVLIALFEEMEP